MRPAPLAVTSQKKGSQLCIIGPFSSGMNYVFLIAFTPLADPAPACQSTGFSPGRQFDSLLEPSISLVSNMPQATHIKRHLILNLLQSQPRPLTPLRRPSWKTAQLSSAVNFGNTFARRLFARKKQQQAQQQNQHSSAFLRGTVQLWLSRCSHRCRLCPRRVCGKGVALPAANLFGLQTAKRQ